MELAFIASAIRRYLWLIVIFAALGAAPALLVERGETEYQSQGVLQVVPPLDTPASYSGDPDRYVVGQLSVLRSTALAQSAANVLQEPDGWAAVAAAVEFEHQSATDLVVVRAKTTSPERSRNIVNAYLEAYRAHLLEQSALNPIEDEIDAVEKALTEVQTQISSAMAPYLNAQPVEPGDPYPPIPAIDQVAPSLASQQLVLVNRLTDLNAELARRTSLRDGRLDGLIPQDATLPTAPLSESRSLQLAAGVLGGALLGLLLALVAARLSPRVLDEADAADILGAPLLGVFPRERGLRRRRRAALEDPPPSVGRFADTIRVRAEAVAVSGESLTVAVVGTGIDAGVTTIASALAGVFADNDSSVLLVDADPQRSDLMATYAHREATRPAVRSLPAKLRGLLVPTAMTPSGVGVTTFSRQLASSTARRRHLADAMDAAKRQADVVIFDGGALMASAATIELVKRCNAVVLAVPEHEVVRTIADVAAELQSRSVIAVWTRTRRSPLRRLTDLLLGRRRRSATASTGSDGPPPGAIGTTANGDPSVGDFAAGTALDRDTAAAFAGGALGEGPRFRVDDLRLIEGIGPRIEQLLQAGGITTWAALAQTSERQLRDLLDSGGLSSRLHNPEAWPQQAELLAAGRWDELPHLADLNAGH